MFQWFKELETKHKIMVVAVAIVVIIVVTGL
jgi:hypothetical protein